MPQNTCLSWALAAADLSYTLLPMAAARNFGEGYIETQMAVAASTPPGLYDLILTADNNLGPAGVEPAARVPVAVWRQGVQLEGALRWDEQACRSGALGRLAPEDVHALLRGDI